MDISVSRLNQRMALQLPAELPLGLVFVVGQIQLPDAAQQTSRPGDFYLGDSEYRLPCRLSKRAAAEVHLGEGDMIRAGGHLVFEPAWASYYLLARDIEHLDGIRPAAKPLTAIIADNHRREQATSLAPAELPAWVQSMAPPEIRSQQMGQSMGTNLTGSEPEPTADWEILADAQEAVAYPGTEPALAELSDELIAFLSLAMDSKEDVELTSELLSDLQLTGTSSRLPPSLLEALDEVEASVSHSSKRSTPLPNPLEPSIGEVTSDSTVDEAYESPSALADQTDLGQPADVQIGPLADELSEALAALEAEALGAAALDEPAAEPTPVSASTATPEPVAKPDPSTADQVAGKSPKKSPVIPWYVVVLVIVAFVILLGAVIFLLLYPEIEPIQLPLAELSRGLHEWS